MCKKNSLFHITSVSLTFEWISIFIMFNYKFIRKIVFKTLKNQTRINNFLWFIFYLLNLSQKNDFHLFRHLALKKADDDYRYFVQYEGSAFRLDKLAGHCCLQLVTKRYKCSLLDTIKNGNLTKEKKKQNYAISAARGLRFLHKHHVVHKDVQLSNFLVCCFLGFFCFFFVFWFLNHLWV